VRPKPPRRQRRPSLIELSISIKHGELTSAAIAGEAVVVAEGTIEA